ncbi:MAG: VanZ family protein, partial [Janthinobacterium lividum]
VSATIEVGQGVGDVLLGLTRTVDVNDLVANVTGTVLGLLALRAVLAVTGSAPERFALPGSAVAATSGRPAAQTGPRWLLDDLDDLDDLDELPSRTGAAEASTLMVVTEHPASRGRRTGLVRE